MNAETSINEIEKLNLNNFSHYSKKALQCFLIDYDEYQREEEELVLISDFAEAWQGITGNDFKALKPGDICYDCEGEKIVIQSSPKQITDIYGDLYFEINTDGEECYTEGMLYHTEFIYIEPDDELNAYNTEDTNAKKIIKAILYGIITMLGIIGVIALMFWGIYTNEAVTITVIFLTITLFIICMFYSLMH